MNKIYKNLSNARGRKSAFTLGELLIAIAIIGIVAALTIPQLVTNYQKHVVETHLKKFYNSSNQALLRYIADNGETFEYPCKSNGPCSYNETLSFLKKTILPYIKYNKYEKCKMNNYFTDAVCLWMNNGDLAVFATQQDGPVINYCINCKINTNSIIPENPRKKFVFLLYIDPDNLFQDEGHKIQPKHSIQPYALHWNGTIEGLKNDNNVNGAKKNGCRKNNTIFDYCAKYIQLNGWKIPADYPW